MAYIGPIVNFHIISSTYIIVIVFSMCSDPDFVYEPLVSRLIAQLTVMPRG